MESALRNPRPYLDPHTGSTAGTVTPVKLTPGTPQHLISPAARKGPQSPTMPPTEAQRRMQEEGSESRESGEKPSALTLAAASIPKVEGETTRQHRLRVWAQVKKDRKSQKLSNRGKAKGGAGKGSAPATSAGGKSVSKGGQSSKKRKKKGKGKGDNRRDDLSPEMLTAQPRTPPGDPATSTRSGSPPPRKQPSLSEKLDMGLEDLVDERHDGTPIADDPYMLEPHAGKSRGKGGEKGRQKGKKKSKSEQRADDVWRHGKVQASTKKLWKGAHLSSKRQKGKRW